MKTGGIYYGWTIALFAAVIAFCSGPGQSFVFSVFVDSIIDDTGFSRSGVSILYAAGTGVSAVMVTLVSRAADRYGPRHILIVVGLALGGVCFALASAQSMLIFVIAFAALRALGQGSLPINGTLLVAQWFVRYRARAVSIMGLGFAVATAILPPLCRLLIDNLGWRETYAVLGVMVWLLILPGALFLVRDTPEEVGLLPDGDPVSTGQRIAPRQPLGPDKRRVFTSPTFWALALPMATPSFIVTALVFHQTGIFEERGLSATIAGVVFVPFAVAAAVSAVAGGVIIDKWGPRPAFILTMALMLVALVYIHVVGSYLTAVIYAVILGSAGAIAQTLSGVIWAHFYGRDGLGRIQGSATMIGIAAAAVGPLPLALLQQAFASFQAGLAIMAALPLFATVLILLARPASPDRAGRPGVEAARARANE